MSDEIAIKVEGLSKLYRLGEIGTGTLSHDMNRFFAKIRGKEDPYSIIGQTNDRTIEASSDYVWALEDINFEVKKGEVLGIIGKNGAGKSTLLKLVSQITSPTKGSIKAKGRIASLLEVGTGMHPEMTARENIFLNGALLGMNKQEIKSKFDEIIEFAGCQMYIDTPLKRFSSGMRVRLGFAVAAFLEPEILIVDEVLAVGDAEFQKKAIGKMKDVSQSGGRTVLFVSHNMASVKSLCDRAIVLEHGKLTIDTDVSRAVDYYFKGNSESSYSFKTFEKNEISANNFNLLSIGIKSQGKEFENPISIDDSIELVIEFNNTTNSDTRLDFNIRFKGEDGTYIFNSSSGYVEDAPIKNGKNKVVMHIPNHFFSFKTYYIDLMITENFKKVILNESDIIVFTVNPKKSELGRTTGQGKTYLKPRFEWSTEKI